MTIGENIKKIREQRDISQTELGRIAGVTDKAVSTWENDIKVPRMGSIQKIADYFNISKSEIIEDSDKPSTVLTKDKQALVDTYDQLNQTGKQKLTDYANDLVSSGRYSSDDDIRTFKVAARNGKDTIELTKEQREELIKISKEPFDIPKGTF